MKFANYVIELRLSSRHKWSHVRLHKRPYYSHFVWGPISVIYGQPHLEPVTVCADCYEQIERVGAYGDSLNWCESCQQVEGDTLEMTMEEYEAAHG